MGDNAAEDSCNILPALLGQKSEKPIREATVHQSSRGNFAIRKGDWVLVLTIAPGVEAVLRDGMRKLLRDD